MSEIIDYGENLYDNELLWVDNYYLNRGGSKDLGNVTSGDLYVCDGGLLQK